MKLNDIVKLSVNSLFQRGLRSWLTILGIVIGVAAVVSILSIGSGMQQTVSSQLGGLGADILTISSGFNRAFGPTFGERPREITTNSLNLTVKDLQVVKSVSGVQYAEGIISGRADISYLSQSSSVQVQGVDPLVWQQMTTSTLESGRYLTAGDGNSVVIGYRIANDMFKQPLTVNTQIMIGGETFKVVGILAQSGGVGDFSGYDNTVFMPISTARTVIDDVPQNQFSSLQVKVTDTSTIDNTMSSIEQALLISRHMTDETKDFTITSAQSMQETISSVMNTLSLFLAGIATISLLVGAIGIANTMFMSVMERTRQIGTLKALGTTNFEVMKLFLFESALIGLIGGLIGIFSGFIASGAISELGIRIMGITERGGMGTSVTVITPQLVLLAVGFSVFIGAISGLLPARRAASLQPVEALRYE